MLARNEHRRRVQRLGELELLCHCPKDALAAMQGDESELGAQVACCELSTAIRGVILVCSGPWPSALAPSATISG